MSWNSLNLGGYTPPLMDASSLGGYNLGDLLGGPAAATKGPMGFGDYMSEMFSGGAFGKTLGDGTKLGGWAMPAISLASGAMNSILGFKSLGLQKDAFNQSKKEFDMNWAAQQKTVNGQMEDRQRARVASNPNAYQSVADYMKNKGI